MHANRFFNNSGPVNDIDHFCVSPIKRFDNNKIWQLILQKKYFLICGPKQCGKTSYLLALANVINQKKHAKCLYFNVESLRGVQENIEESIRSILFEISSRARDTFDDEYLEELVPNILQTRGPYQALNELLTQWAKRSELPIVLLIDELDTIEGPILTSILSQIRAGYDKRPKLFPQSIIFCATHDVIDKQFNIKDTTIRLGNFEREAVAGMFAAYTANSHVEITKWAIDRVWQHSSGQPWIVSSLASEIFHEIMPAKGIKKVTPELVDEAFGNILAKMGNHLEFLASQLRDERVKRCLIPILSGGSLAEAIPESDFTFTQELGLISAERNSFDNGLYSEVIPLVLFTPVTYMINLDTDQFLAEDASLDSLKVLRYFQEFFRKHIERLVAIVDYGTAAYTLVFQALLQKLSDGNISIVREQRANQGRIVLKLHRIYPVDQRITFLVKQAKVWSNERFKQTLGVLSEEAAAYAAANPDTCGTVHMVLINTNPEFDWDGRYQFERKGTPAQPIFIWGF